MGSCSIIAIELWGIFCGLLISWNLGYRNVWRETNSICAFQLINHDIVATLSHISLVKAIQDLLNRDWNVVFRHEFREANRCADRLAKFEHSLPLGLSFYDKLPTCISIEFQPDLSGHNSPRFLWA